MLKMSLLFCQFGGNFGNWGLLFVYTSSAIQEGCTNNNRRNKEYRHVICFVFEEINSLLSEAIWVANVFGALQLTELQTYQIRPHNDMVHTCHEGLT